MIGGTSPGTGHLGPCVRHRQDHGHAGASGGAARAGAGGAAVQERAGLHRPGVPSGGVGARVVQPGQLGDAGGDAGRAAGSGRGGGSDPCRRVDGPVRRRGRAGGCGNGASGGSGGADGLAGGAGDRRLGSGADGGGGGAGARAVPAGGAGGRGDPEPDRQPPARGAGAQGDGRSGVDRPWRPAQARGDCDAGAASGSGAGRRAARPAGPDRRGRRADARRAWIWTP